MKGSGLLVFILILSGLSALRCGATVYYSNGSAANVQQIHDTQAVDGDTITIPAGTFTWSTTVRISKGITLRGQTTTNPVNKTANDQTIILDSVSRPSNNTPLIEYQTVLGKSYRLSGITFRTGTQVVNYNGMIGASGNSQAIRIDHCHFDDLLYENNYVAVDGQVYGVIDHNLFDFRNPHNNREAIRVFGDNYGDVPWAEPAYYGSEKFVFVEDNCFNATTGVTNATMDDFDGARYVFRHNHVYDMVVQTHGTEIGRDRGSRCLEVYNNDFHWTLQISAVGGIRSGGVITHDNTHDGAHPQHGSMTLEPYRIFIRFAVWGGASGDNPWDYNVTEPDGTHVDGHPPYLFESGTAEGGSNQTTIVDTTKLWTPNRWVGYTAKRVSDNGVMIITSNTNNTLRGYYNPGYGGGVTWQAGNQYQIHRVLVALDQPGRGAGMINRNNPSWPHQAVEPCYSWNDIYTPTGEHLNIELGIGAFAVLQEGRDYFNDTPMPGYTPYIYPHPLVTGTGRALVADFNGDGHPDFVVQNARTHQTAIWYLNNNVFIGDAYGPTLPNNWGLRGVRDFNHDTHSDYALFNSVRHQTGIWYLSGPTFIGSAYGPNVPGGWELVATGDFNNNGYADYVLYSARTHQTAIWYLNNNVWTGSAYGPTFPNGWQLIGVADFNRDGHPDYLLFNSSTGQTAIWYLSGPTFIGSAYGPIVPGGWTLVATADFNGDGYPDFLLYNPATRQTGIWYLNNNVFVGSAYGPTLPAGWSLIVP